MQKDPLTDGSAAGVGGNIHAKWCGIMTYGQLFVHVGFTLVVAYGRHRRIFKVFFMHSIIATLQQNGRLQDGMVTAK